MRKLQIGLIKYFIKPTKTTNKRKGLAFEVSVMIYINKIIE